MEIVLRKRTWYRKAFQSMKRLLKRSRRIVIAGLLISLPLWLFLAVAVYDSMQPSPEYTDAQVSAATQTSTDNESYYPSEGGSSSSGQTPEPSSTLAMLTGLGVLTMLRRKK